MIIKYTNTPNDIMAEYLFLIKRTDSYKKDIRSMKIMYYFLAAIMAIIGIYNLIVFFGNVSENIDALAQAISQFVVAMLTFSFSFLAPFVKKIADKLTIKNKIKKENRTYQENVIDISDNQIKYSGDKQGIVKATEQKLVHEDKKYIYIVFRKGVLTIPKTSINDLDGLKKLIHGTQI